MRIFSRKQSSQAATDKALVARSVAGDKEAFRILVDKYQAKAYSIAFGVLQRKEDAEDVVQESFVKAFLSLKDFKGESAFYTWFYRIVFNMSVDYRRKIMRRGGPPVEYDELMPPSGIDSSVAADDLAQNPHTLMARKETAKQFAESLKELSEDHRTVIALREFEGLSYEEIADVTGVSKGTVMSRLHYARKKLQEELESRVEDGGNGAGGDGVATESALTEVLRKVKLKALAQEGQARDKKARPELGDAVGLKNLIFGSVKR